jgi:hypothetical protein
MSLLRKVRTLVGALAHKPFTPRVEKVELEEGPDQRQPAPGQDRTPLEAHEPEVVDTGRVADLIAKQKES